MSQTQDLLRRHARDLMLYASIEAGRETVQQENKDTGFMATTTQVTPVEEGGEVFSADIFVPAEYAKYVVFGTRPHVIRPRGNGVLSFDGHFAKVVHHPGYAGNDFIFAPMPERFHRKLEEAIIVVVTQ